KAVVGAVDDHPAGVEVPAEAHGILLEHVAGGDELLGAGLRGRGGGSLGGGRRGGGGGGWGGGGGRSPGGRLGDHGRAGIGDESSVERQRRDPATSRRTDPHWHWTLPAPGQLHAAHLNAVLRRRGAPEQARSPGPRRGARRGPPILNPRPA